MLDFLGKFCTARGGMTASLEADLRNQDIMRQLRVLGLYGKVLTGFWMTIVYCEAGKNLEMTAEFNHCIDFLESFSADPYCF